MKVETKKDLIEYTALMISSSGFWKPNSYHDLNYTAKEVAEFVLENAEVDANWRTVLANYHNTHNALLKSHESERQLSRKNRELTEDNAKAAKIIGNAINLTLKFCSECQWGPKNLNNCDKDPDECKVYALKVALNANHCSSEKVKE